MTAALEGGEWSAARPGRTLPPGKTRCPFDRRLGGPQGRSGRAQNLVPTGIRSRTVQIQIQRRLIFVFKCRPANRPTQRRFSSFSTVFKTNAEMVAKIPSCYRMIPMQPSRFKLTEINPPFLKINTNKLICTFVPCILILSKFYLFTN